MEYIKPKAIAQGMTIGIVSLSGCVKEQATIERGVLKLNELGFKTKLSEHILDKNRYLAGRDEDRVSELHKFFADPDIDCILCSRGGYGALRILDKIDYSFIRLHPKAFCGYSDITAYSAMLLKNAGLITYSAPMLCGDFGQEEVSDFTISNFLSTISHAHSEFEIVGNKGNSAEGIAFGGNLTTLASLCGRDFLPDKEFIFIIEDVNEPAYKIDRCLEQLATLENFKRNIRGLVTGDFTGSNGTDVSEILNEFTKQLKIPLWEGLKLGHDKEKITFPIGGECYIKENKIFF